MFQDFTKLRDEWELFGKELVFIDGSKFRACNAKKNNYSHKKLERHLQYLDKKIDKYMQELDHKDIAEFSNWKPNNGEIKERIQQLRNRIEKYEQYQKQLQQSGQNELSIPDPGVRFIANNNNDIDVSYMFKSFLYRP